MPDEKKYPHEGHRDRVKQRFLNVGFENMQDYEILEMVLFYAIPRRDTNDMAKKILSHFGSLINVLDASTEELEKCGLSGNTAIYIKMAGDLCKKYHADKTKNTITKLSAENPADKFETIFNGTDKNKKVAVALFDEFGRKIYISVVYEGSFSETDGYIKKVMEISLTHHAWGIVFAYDNSENIPMPSARDINTIYILKHKMANVNVKLIDCIVFSECNSVSLSSIDEFKNIFTENKT